MDKVDFGGMKNSQFLACYTAEHSRQDKRLNEAYRVATAKAPPKIKESLLAGQRAWILYRDSWCGYVAALDQAPNGEVNRLSCLVDLTEAQEKQLRENYFQ